MRNRKILAGVILFAVVVFYVISTAHRNRTLYRNGEEKMVKFGETRVPFHAFSGVETLRAEKSPELIQEITNVIEQKGMPSDVFVDNQKEAMNIASTLNTVFGEYAGKPGDLELLWRASPIDVWDVNKAALDKVDVTLKNFETARLIVRGMLEQQETFFDCIYRRSKDWSWSISIDAEASKYIPDDGLLEEYSIAKSLLKGDIAGATDTLAYIFRLAQLSDAVGLPSVRSDAAMTRLRAIEVMQRIVLDPKFEKIHLIQLHDMLMEQLEQWTSEQRVWFGDRASGIRLYHRIMMTGPEEALEENEVNKLKDRNVYGTFVKNYIQNHANDEIFYLRSMQKIIAASEKQFHLRVEVLNDIQNFLLAKEDTAEEYFVSGFLLADIDRLMQIYAQDQSRLETAVLAMTVSLGIPNKLTFADPFTGKPYEVKQTGGMVIVSAQNKHRPFRVPDFSSGK
jgi:hypothetical protein